MHIYVDESGTFAGVGKVFSPSVVGALVVPDHKHEALLRQYRRLRRTLPKEKDQVKGRLLNETQVQRVVSLLRQVDALFFADFIEMGFHTAEGLKQHRAGSAEGMVVNLTEEHHPDVKAAIHTLKHRLEQLPLQLYVQAIVLNQVLARVLAEATAYFAQRHPKELSRFEWILDAKGNSEKLTEWEDWWKKIFMPLLQSQSLRRPAWKLEGADYSHFSRFEMEVPDYMLPHMSAIPNLAKSINLKLVFAENLRITNQAEHGLELVDIITNCLRRAFKGTLEQEGWLPIRSIMIHRRGQYIDVLDLEGTQESRTYPAEYKRVFDAFRYGGRSMLTR